MSDIIPQNNPQVKRCPTCPEDNQWHPATTEFWHRHKRMKDGWASRCKKCRQKDTQSYYSRPEVKTQKHAYNKAYWQRPGIRERSNVTHTIRNQRPEVRERNNAHARERYRRPEVREQRLSRQKIYESQPKVKDRRQARNKAYYTSHLKAYMSQPSYRAYQRDWHKAYYRRPEIREHKRNYNREYFNNPEIHERIRKQRKVYHEIYYSLPENREKYYANSRNRRARKQNVSGSHTPKQVQEQLKRQRHTCYYCSTKLDKKGGKYIYHVDHIVPISRGGSNDISNLVITCPFCNLSKHDKLPHEWPEGGRLL